MKPHPDQGLLEWPRLAQTGGSKARKFDEAPIRILDHRISLQALADGRNQSLSVFL